MIITCKKDKICKIEKKMSVVKIKMETRNREKTNRQNGEEQKKKYKGKKNI